MDIAVTLTGYVGGEVETRATRAGVPVATFRVGTTPSIRRDDAWADGPTTWTTVTCFRSLADHVAQSLKKGDPVIVSGRLRTQTWVDASGENRERLVVEAAQVGHDLSRGTAAFQRERRRQTDEPPLAPEDADGLAAADLAGAVAA
jgi:single-strand DNA-binding protein